MDSSWDDEVLHTVLDHFDLDFNLIFRFFVSIPLYQITKPQMSLVLDKFV